jgi:hypothetical protein
VKKGLPTIDDTRENPQHRRLTVLIAITKGQPALKRQSHRKETLRRQGKIVLNVSDLEKSHVY